MSGGGLPLRIGLLVDGPEVPAWLALALSEVAARRIGEVALIVEREPDPVVHLSRGARLWQNRSKLAFVLAERLDAQRAKLPPKEPSLALASIAPSAEVLRVRPATTTWLCRTTASPSTTSGPMTQ